MKNTEISLIFREIAKILEIKGENVFRIRAYERAAQNLEVLTEDIAEYVKESKLTGIPGIGGDLAAKISEYINTGRIKAYEELKKSIPEGLLELLDIPSVGPRTVKLLHEKLKIKNISDLEKAVQNNRIRNIPGIKEKTVENILKGIKLVKKGRERMPLLQAIELNDEITAVLKKLPEAKKISCAGSLRRRKETVRDIDILITSNRPEKIMSAFTGMPLAREILAQGQTKSSIRTPGGIQIDCRVVEEKCFGAALLYFTGSKNFNIKIRQLAIKKGFKINEYGVFKGNAFKAGKSEEEIFSFLKLAYITPELREDTGEIELAAKFKLPRLVEISDIKGDLHVHSKWSDGNNTIEEMGAAAKKRGYAYIAVTDHSQGLKIAGGLNLTDLKKKKKEIDKINEKLKNFRVLFGTEVDIDSEGGLDYNDSVLKSFDIVVAAIHSGFRQSPQQITKRITRACENKYVHVIAHPTGRLRGVREPYEMDIDKVFKVARETNTHFEINSFPDRLDFNDQYCRRAKEAGVKLSLNTDSHSTQQLNTIELGLMTARRGWLEAKDVINTLSVDELLKKIKK